jgi:hypothetical protein
MTDEKIEHSDETARYIDLLENKIKLMEKIRKTSDEIISKQRTQIDLLKKENELLRVKKE